MFNAAQFDLLGPVRSVRSEVAEWDEDAGAWTDRRFFRFRAFDAAGRLTQLDHDTIHRTQYIYDALGRVFEEASGPGDQVVFRRRWAYDEQGREKSISIVHEDGTQEVWQQSTYDEDGRRTDRIALPGGIVHLMRYDESGQPTGGELVDASGAVRPTDDADPDALDEDPDNTRFAYLYDTHGNWIEKVVSVRLVDGSFVPTNVEWRTIGYYE
jgi:YD repeat-containing protein